MRIQGSGASGHVPADGHAEPVAADGNPTEEAAVVRNASRSQATPAPATVDLGEIDKPGAKLKGSTQVLVPGETLKFRTRENQIWGLGQITVKPAGALTLSSKQLQPMHAGQLGSTSLNEYSFTVPKNAKPGTVFTVTTAANYQSRNDPSWAFSFKVKVSK